MPELTYYAGQWVESWRCDECGDPVSPDWEYCSYCGAELNL